MADLDQTEPQVTAHPDSTRDAHPETASPVTPPTELQPCPFCGCEVRTLDMASLQGRCVLWYVTHPDRHCVFGTGAVTQPFYSEVEAIAAWNTRAPGEDAVAGDWEVGGHDGLYFAHNAKNQANIWVLEEATAKAYRDALNRADALLKGGKP